MEPKNSGTRPAAVPGGLGQPGGPGQPPPGSIPTGELFVVVFLTIKVFLGQVKMTKFPVSSHFHSSG